MKPRSREARQVLHERCARSLAKADFRSIFSDQPMPYEAMHKAIATARVSAALAVLGDISDPESDLDE